MGVLAPLVGTGWDVSGGGGGARGQGLPACKQGHRCGAEEWEDRHGSRAPGSLWDEPKTDKVGPTGSSYHSCWKTQTADVAGALHLQPGSRGHPSSLFWATACENKSQALSPGQARSQKRQPREAGNTAPSWGADSTWGT